EHARAELAPGVLNVSDNQASHQLHVLRIIERLEIDHLGVAAPLERVVRIEHVSDAPTHARGEIPPGPAKDGHAAARHVFAAVIADAFDDRKRTAVARRKSLARDAPEIRLAARGAVERYVPDEDVVFRDEARVPRWEDDQLPSREPFTNVVVRV